MYRNIRYDISKLEYIETFDAISNIYNAPFLHNTLILKKRVMCGRLKAHERAGLGRDAAAAAPGHGGGRSGGGGGCGGCAQAGADQPFRGPPR